MDVARLDMDTYLRKIDAESENRCVAAVFVHLWQEKGLLSLMQLSGSSTLSAAFTLLHKLCPLCL